MNNGSVKIKEGSSEQSNTLHLDLFQKLLLITAAHITLIRLGLDNFLVFNVILA